MPSFADLDLIPPLLKALEDEGYTTPTPIQAEAIPALLEGRDLLGIAQTGTGKTAAFSLPVIQHLWKNRRSGARRIRALVISPTRELAAQIGERFAAYGAHIDLRSTVIFGGVSQRPQVSKLRNGLDILVATPGRLLDLQDQGYIDLSGVEYLILDEADRMLDMGFIRDIRRVISLIPAKRQSLLFSATMPNSIASLANSLLNKPVRIEVVPESTPVERIEQRVMFVSHSNKRTLLTDLLGNPAITSAIVFTRTKHGANRVVKHLDRVEVKSAAIHGNKSQGARTRALSGFKDGSIRVLVATDVAARGIDVDDISHVINFDLPHPAEVYVHRIGRTGRAGASGQAISFCDETESDYLRAIEKLIGMRLEANEDHDWHDGSIRDSRPPPKKQQGGRGGRGGGGRGGGGRGGGGRGGGGRGYGGGGGGGGG
ncbi:MAG: DEAD/DEAH box helicase, partial [Myxococcota bacterium]|nr:DEAD/DEAH box helicase [Myxococcota bacterium]